MIPFDKEIYKILIKEAQENFIDPMLCVAIATVESNWNPWAVRYEPQWNYLFKPEYFAKRLAITQSTESVLQSCSWGLMQVMGSVARELGFSEPLQQLCGPSYGVEIGCKKLFELKKKYKKEQDIIAAYNAGSPVLTMDGKYKNQNYVDKVVSILLDLRANRYD